MIRSMGPLAFVLWLWSLGKSGGAAPSSATPTPPALPPGERPAPPPWPQVVPEGLPPFPGNGWEYDEPPPAAVQERARQLLSQLWARGAGTSKVEQTAGRWIAYQAAIVAGGKKGVVAFRMRRTAQPAAPVPVDPNFVMTTARSPGLPSSSRLPKTAPSSSSAPKTPPKLIPVARIEPRRPTPEQAAAQSAASQRYSLPLARELPDLKVGMGLKPAAPNPHVKLAQERLQFHGYKVEADGRFGDFTRMAIIELQKRAALAPRVTNAELLKRGFGAVKQPTWEVLLQDRPLLTSPPLVRA